MQGVAILIVEDDAGLRETLAWGFRDEGFAPDEASTAAMALERLEAHTYDCLIIDIGLPDGDGRDLCRALRGRGCEAPILFLTARCESHDVLAGFASGGDDYLKKPFEFPELVARVRALLRRAGGDEPREALGLLFDPIAHTVHRDGSLAALTPTEFCLLTRLAQSGNLGVDRHELIHSAWPAGAIVSENTLDAYISHLRRKLSGLSAPCEITTVRGVGYVLGEKA